MSKKRGNEVTKKENNTVKDSEQLSAEELNRLRFSRYWKVFLIVFILVCAVIIIYFAFHKKDAHVKLGQYKGLTYKQIDVSVSNEEVEAEKERLVNTRTTYVKLEDDGTPVGEGEEDCIVNCSYIARYDDKVLEEGSDNFEIGSGKFGEFEEAIKGKCVGDTVTIEAAIPETYAGKEALKDYAGETVNFDITINFVSKKNIPEITNDFVVDVSGGECQTTDAFDSYIKDKLAKEKESEAESSIIQELIDKVIANSTFTDIDGMVQEYYDTMYNTYLSAAQHYELSMGEYIRQFYAMELEDFQKELKSTMVDLVKEQLVLNAIVEAENLKLSSERYNTYLEQYMEDYGYTNEEAFIEYYGEDSIRESMMYDYAIDFLIENSEPQS